MIEVRDARTDDLPYFHAMDGERDTRDHITRYTLEEHRREFGRDDVVYLAILADARLAGYFILVLEADSDCVEFRRIVVAEKGKGTGQAAILAMEAYCVECLRRERIWLDVFETNPRGLHVYQKLGYRQFDSDELDGRKLLLLEKRLD